MTRRMRVCDIYTGTFLVPLADFINHGADMARFSLFNKQFELNSCKNRPDNYISLS
jgi:hypothetical protein